MRKLSLMICMAVVIACSALTASGQKHEHRAVWMSAFVGDWPTSPILAANPNSHKNICINNLDSLQRNHMNAIYYHVRTMCDAMYNSAYEPWSSYVSGTRGQEPPFDPFAYLIENAHARGIEVYAWLNPYRYINSIYADGYGNNGGDKNYENSHPDWLIKWQYSDNGSTRTWTILNPALDEVKQRIVDIVADIMSKYDIDGVVFDDYFYQSGLPTSYDATQYNAYKAAGGMLSQADWRRENVNDMVRRVNAYIKSTKPWVRFGIGPAGVACGTNLSAVAKKYGIEPCPGSDWQYNSIYSDPIAWYNEGTIDFMSPQVYWPINPGSSTDYKAISEWWYKMADKFNRHAYISQDLSNSASQSIGFTEFSTEIDVTRNADTKAAPGTVYFPWKSLKSMSTRVNSKVQYLLNYLRYNSFQNVAIPPVVTWVNTTCPGQVSNVSRSGRTLTWNGPDNVKFTVYAVPKSMSQAAFDKNEQCLKLVSYSKSCEIPAYNAKYPEFGIADADLDNYNYAVAVLDRYGNEYSAVFVGATVKQSQKPVITYPTNGGKAGAAFNFAWTGTSLVYEIAIATDAQMKNTLVKREVTGNTIASGDVYDFEADKTYYCQVATRENNASEAISDVVAFSVDAFHIISPANGATDCQDDLTISWSATNGVDSHLVICKDATMENVVYETTVKASQHKVPAYTLSGNVTYYAQVTAGDVASKVVSFTVKNIVPSKPTFIVPATSGATVYSNQSIEVNPARGITVSRIEVSAKNTFPARTSYVFSSTKFEFKTDELQNAKLGSSALADGTTYYARAKFSYYDESMKTKDTEYSDIVEFVYNANGGINIVGIGGIRYADGRISTGMADADVMVYGADGKLMLAGRTGADGTLSLNPLQPGVYMVKCTIDGKPQTLKIVK